MTDFSLQSLLKSSLAIAGGSLLLLSASSRTDASTNRLGEARQWFIKALDAYDHDHLTAARTPLQLSLEAEPNFEEANLLKGLLFYREGRVEEAQASVRRARDLVPRMTSDIRDRLETQARQIAVGLAEQETAHFKVQVHGTESTVELLKSLDAACQDVSTRLGVSPSGKIPVFIFGSTELWEAWKTPFWLGGLFDKVDGTVRLRADDPPGGAEGLGRRLRHEMAHALVHQMYGKELPLWFQEGVAQLYANDSSDRLWKENRLAVLQKLLEGAPWMGLDQVQQVLSGKDASPTSLYLSYLESEALALQVAIKQGDSWIPSLLQGLQKGDSFDASFQKTAGSTPAEAMTRLRPQP